MDEHHREKDLIRGTKKEKYIFMRITCQRWTSVW